MGLFFLQVVYVGLLFCPYYVVSLIQFCYQIMTISGLLNDPID